MGISHGDFHGFKTWASTGILGGKEQAKFI
jgi:hypothetical protein